MYDLCVQSDFSTRRDFYVGLRIGSQTSAMNSKSIVTV